ncbi:MAG: ATP-binding cassette domain-containing protein [Proteobacteria bacterium]|nr:ATP-binding cassette domain-containing protein [Pseudomonadota bacterium]MBU4468997.1 ATP-binding cassette domain-containing protein [Pseudomonadota bacterium]MCG2750936.1 ATP-binding cassette domain-containing protein [Desulfobacteraceae bacterium]
MALISMRDVFWGIGGFPLLDHITFQMEKGERIGLLGRNGVGKSTLMKIMAGEMEPDGGEIWKQQGIKIGVLKQDVPLHGELTVFDVVAGRSGISFSGLENSSSGIEPKNKASLENANLAHDTNTVLSKFNLDPGAIFSSLSAGMKRRVLFARAFSNDPDILFLDEPTNHLDIETIVWMEDFILRQVKTLFFVTHDRMLLQRIATRILELDRGQVTSYTCDYSTYLKRRQGDLDSEEKRNAVFDKKLAAEETWIRQGIKARRTRNEGRVRALEELRKIRKERRKKIGEASLKLQEAEKTGKLVVEVSGINYSYHENICINNFSTVIARGDKIGIIGPNGAGKTTLLKLLLKEIEPQTGYVRHGTNLQIAYFDQLRATLDEQKTVRENIGEGNDYVVVNGDKRHVIGYLQDFLFSPDRCHTPVHILSGGEKNRLTLAKLFARPANLLVMDEPTNDLDAETLELLEDLLFQYQGTLLLVSHDRAFLNQVVTSTMVFEGDGSITEYAGGYDDWLKQRPSEKPAQRRPDKGSESARAREKQGAKPLRKLGYMEKRELESLPRHIDTLEKEHQHLFEVLSDPLFYKKDKNEMASVKAGLENLEMEIEKAYQRWEELDAVEKQQ